MKAINTRWLLRGLGYVLFFGVVFFVSLIVTFPYRRLNTRAEQLLEKTLGREVTIEKVRPTLLGGVHLDGLTIGPKIATARFVEEAEPPPWRIDSLSARVSFLRLLIGRTRVSFDAELADGSVEGVFYRGGDETRIALEIEGIELRRLPSLRDRIGLPVKGQIGGEVDITCPENSAAKAQGTAELRVSGVVIGDGKAKLSVDRLLGFGSRRTEPADEEGGFVVQPIEFGELRGAAKVSGGTIEIPRMEATSSDAEIAFEGRIKLRDPVAESRVETYLSFKLSEAYAQSDDTTKGLLRMVESYPATRRAKGTDGFFTFRLGGTLGGGVSLRAGGARGPLSESQAGRSRRRTSPVRRGFSLGNDDLSDEPEDDDLSPPGQRGPYPGAMPRPPTLAPPGEDGEDDVYPSGMPRPHPTGPSFPMPIPSISPDVEQPQETDTAPVEGEAEGPTTVE